MTSPPAGAAHTKEGHAIPADAVARRPRLGFVGVGWIGRHRMAAIAGSGFAEIAALCDPVAKLAVDAARAVHLDERAVITSFDELLESQPDGIVIATPSALHADQAIAALERGIAVFCQKPLARTAPETARVVDAARANDRLLGVDLSYRFTQGMGAIRDIVRAGSSARSTR